MAFIASTTRIGIVNLTDVALANSLGQPGNSLLPSVTTEPQFAEVVTGYDDNLGGGEFMYARAAATIVAAQTISSITISGTTATLTTGSAHGLVVGQVIQISGAVPLGYNGVVQILTVGTTTTMTFTIATNTPTVSATTVGTYVAGIGAGMVCELGYVLAATGVLSVTTTPWTGTANSGKPIGVAVTNLFPGQSGWLQIEGATITVTNGTVTANAPLYWQSNGTVSSTLVASKQLVSATAATAGGVTIGSGSAAVVLPAFMAVVFLQRPSAQDQLT